MGTGAKRNCEIEQSLAALRDRGQTGIFPKDACRVDHRGYR